MHRIKLILIIIIMLGITYTISLDKSKTYIMLNPDFKYHEYTITNTSGNTWDFYYPNSQKRWDYWSINSNGSDYIGGKFKAELIKGEVYLTGKNVLLVNINFNDYEQVKNINFDNIDNFRYPPDITIENINFIKHPEFFKYERPPGNLYGGEYGTIELDIVNNGRGDANLIEINMEGGPLKERAGIISLGGAASSNEGSGSTTKHISLPISAPLSTEDTRYELVITATEYNGFDADPENFDLQVLAVPQPAFQLENLTWDDDKSGDSWGNSDGIINKGEAVEAIASIKNIGTGIANDVNITISMANKPNGLFLYEDQKLTFYKEGLLANETVDIPFYFVTNKKIEVDNFTVDIDITEESGEFGKDFKIDFYINEQWTFEKYNTSKVNGNYYWEWGCTADPWKCQYGTGGNRYTITFKKDGEWQDQDGKSGSFTQKGETLRFYLSGSWYNGKIQNGTILFTDRELGRNNNWRMIPKY